MTSRFVWFELQARNPAGAADFYEELLGWTIRGDGAAFATVSDAFGRWAAIVPDMSGAPGWVPYARVADVEEAATRALELGAQVVQGVTAAYAGRLARLLDPAGASIALWQPRG